MLLAVFAGGGCGGVVGVAVGCDFDFCVGVVSRGSGGAVVL